MLRPALLALLAALTCACSVQLIADHDAATYEEVLRIAKKADLFYGTLLDSTPETRTYTEYAPRYLEIEADLRSLCVRNELRPLNEDSTRIAKDILDLWIKYKEAHKRLNAYPSDKAEIHRDRLERMFMAAADAEAAKKLGASERDARPGDTP